MAHSHITAGLCALAMLAVLGGATGAAQGQDEASSARQADAAHLLALRAHEGLPLETRLAFERRLDLCSDAPDGCARLVADLLTYQAPVTDADTDADAAPVRLIRSPATLLPGSDGEIVGANADDIAAPSGASRPQAIDNQAPVVQSLILRNDIVQIDQGETTLTFDYEITDEGGSYLDYMQIWIQGASEGTLNYRTLLTEQIGGTRASGTVTADLPIYIPEGEYTVYVSVHDNAGNSGGYDVTLSLTVNNANGDSEPPVLEELRITPDPLVMTGEDAELTLDYRFSDEGGSGLRIIYFSLSHTSSAPGVNAEIGRINVNGLDASSRQGRAVLTIPAHSWSGDYHVQVTAIDNVGNFLVLNGLNPSDDRMVRIDNPFEDTQAPIVNRITLSPDAVDSSVNGATLRVDYDIEDPGGAGLRLFWLSLEHETLRYGNAVLLAPPFNLNGARTAQGTFNWSVPSGFPAGLYQVRTWMQDEVRNEHPQPKGLSTTQIIWVNEPGTRAFGPFPDVVQPDGEGRDIFRISGLPSGPPQQIEVGFRDPEIFGFDGAFSDCALDIRPERHSGAEYLILAPDLAACGAFGSADLVFRVTPQAGDLDERILLRRFRLSETGMLTDMAVDRAPLSRWTEDREEAVFGPFEWTETPSTGRLHQFRLSGLYRDIPQSMDIAIANAAVDGFDGAFTDCTLDIPLSEVRYGVYAFTVADLAACGDFGRADLSFRFTDIARVGEPVSLTRLVTTADGSVSDISFDQLTDYPLQPEAISGGRVEVEAGPFEWTGDANAPTRNLFRISGLDGVPGEIEVAINNAAASGYDGAYTDCSLTLRPERAGAHDYLITASDLADCGDFGRADLSFRITAPEAGLVNGVRMRRIAIGAYGDLTDFNFDHDRRDAPQIRESSNNQSNVVLGPFEWTGDQTVGTQNVFRITGINGAPTRIQAALADATNGDFAGSYLDCELTVRPERVSDGDFVITSNDLADCGDFARANVTFRVFANTDQFSDTVRMRRFAVTRTGGLTDFGFDNQ
jgi:hypothetical protein